MAIPFPPDLSGFITDAELTTRGEQIRESVLGDLVTTISTVNECVNPKAGALTTTGWTETTQDPPIFAAVTLGAGGAPAASSELTDLGITTAFHVTGDAGGDGAYVTVDVPANESRYLSAYVYLVSLTATSVRLEIEDGTGVDVIVGSLDELHGRTVTIGSWVRLALLLPATGVDRTLRFSGPKQNGNGAAEWYFTGVLIDAAPTLSDYRDGDFENCFWQGTPNETASSRITPAVLPLLSRIRELDRTVGVSKRQPIQQHDPYSYFVQRRISDQLYEVHTLEGKTGLPGVDVEDPEACTVMCQRFIAMPMIQVPATDGTLPQDPAVTVSGTWTATTPNVRAYNGAHIRSNTAGSTRGYTTPVATTRVGATLVINNDSGFAYVPIDGDYTLATNLPTAQDLVDRGVMTTTQRDACPAGAATRVLNCHSRGHGYTSGQQDRIHLTFAADLPLDIHTFGVQIVGDKASWATDSHVRVSGFTYGYPDLRIEDDGVTVERYQGILTNALSVSEQDIHVNGTTSGALIHGYEKQQSITWYVDGREVALTVDDPVTLGTEVTAVRVGSLQNPDFGGDLATVTTVYRFTSAGLEVSFKREWLQSCVLDFDLRMATFDGWRFTRGYWSSDARDRVLTAHNGSRQGNVQDATLTMWDPDGEIVCTTVIPDVAKTLAGWALSTDYALLEQRTLVQGSTSTKLYVERVSQEGPGSEVAVTAGQVDYSTVIYTAEVRPGAHVQTSRGT
jgi:hypothetical protein